jgi:hypothetical protein
MKPEVFKRSKQAWSDFLDEIGSRCQKLSCTGQADADEPWFRGHTRCDYELLPSLLRRFPKPKRRSRLGRDLGKESDLL